METFARRVDLERNCARASSIPQYTFPAAATNITSRGIRGTGGLHSGIEDEKSRGIERRRASTFTEQTELVIKIHGSLIALPNDDPRFLFGKHTELAVGYSELVIYALQGKPRLPCGGEYSLFLFTHLCHLNRIKLLV